MPDLSEQFRQHFGHREHLYGVLLAELADDLDADGVSARICREVRHTATRSDAIALRLLAGVFRIVLRGEAPDLAACYPCLGGTAPAEAAWPLLRPVLAAHEAELRAALDRPPQTNEVGRSAVLLLGLFEAVREHGLGRIRLLEPGASAGLNLNIGWYGFAGPGWSFGPADSVVHIETSAAGAVPEAIEIVQRRGCDLAPIDISSAPNRDYLTSFVWPWQLDRHARLAGAFAIAQQHPVPLDRAPAAAWLAEQLSIDPGPGVLTVVWESITRQYWPASEAAAVDALIASARSRIPLAHITMEGLPPVQGTDGYAVATHGPELRLDGRLLGRSHHHGPPVLLAS